ncbi:hypothetical protein C4D60_Mb08t26900 [Musa balbisiana]|uniref:Uncharacterized protein n=1 Tax=Musa balbisiana TaxID=52838 RepID=A0A4S8K6R4_MUSBA|nr:hypothetical protein C4D60_Mb08t26900 [Musa balbisiana]
MVDQAVDVIPEGSSSGRMIPLVLHRDKGILGSLSYRFFERLYSMSCMLGEGVKSSSQYSNHHRRSMSFPSYS